MTSEEQPEPSAPARTRSALMQKFDGFRGHEQFVGLVILSIAFIIGSSSISSGIRNRNQKVPTHQITVTGSAAQTVTSNSFQWAANIACTKSTTSAALAQMNSWTGQVRHELIAAGALSSEISFTTINVQPNTDDYNQVISFTMSEWVNLKSARLNAMQPVLGVANRLLGENIPFIANQPKYTFDGLKKLRPLLTREPAANARLRAQDALGKNVQLGKPISISVGAVSVDRPGNVNYGSGDFNTSSIPKVVSVVVYATYSTG